MNNKYRFGLFLVLLISISLSAFGEDVTEADGRFATKKTELRTAIIPGTKILINSARHLSGRLYIVADSPGVALFQYKKLLKVDEKSEAVDYADMIDISFEKTPAGLRILLKAPNPAPWSGTDNSASVEGELHLPPNTPLEISADYFDLNIEGPLKSVENMSSFGRLEVQKITDRLNLTTSNQDIIASDISGEIFLATTNADIRIENMNTGETPAQIRNQSGNVNITQAHGAIDIRDSYGKIKLEDIYLTQSGSQIASSYGPVKMTLAEISKADLSMTNSNDDIELQVPEGIAASFDLAVSSEGEIDASGLPMKPIGVDDKTLEFKCGSGGSEIRIKITGDGNIYLKGIPATGK